MQSITQQCIEVTGILDELQACVDRRGHVIPARAEDFAVYIARARWTMGVSSCAREETAARGLYTQERP